MFDKMLESLDTSKDVNTSFGVPRGEDYILKSLEAFSGLSEDVSILKQPLAFDSLKLGGVGYSFGVSSDTVELPDHIRNSIKLLNLLLKGVKLIFGNNNYSDSVCMYFMETLDNLVFSSLRLLGGFLKENDLSLVLNKFSNKKELLSSFSVILYTLDSYILDSGDLASEGYLCSMVVSTFKAKVSLLSS